MRFTTKSVAALQPRETRYWVNDESLPGFRLAVLPSGVKSFAVRLRSKGGRKNRRDSMHVIGRWGPLTLNQARDRARELLSRSVLGEDVAGARREARSAISVAELSSKFLEERKGKLKPSTLREYRRLFAVKILPVLGSLAARDVTRREVAQLHHSLRATPYAANRVAALIGSMYTWAERHGYLPVGARPTHGVEFFREESRERYLTEIETLKLGRALTLAAKTGLPLHPKRAVYLENRRADRWTKKGKDKRAKGPSRLTPASPFAIGVIRFLLLTGWREREAMTLRWDMLDLDSGRARLPDAKSGLSWRELGGAAVQLLRELPRIAGSPFVFPGQTVDAPISSIQHVWYSVRHAAGLGDVRLHDLRHNYASQGAQQGTSLLVLGAVLGHRQISTTKKYAHLGDSPVKRAADDISAQIAARLDGRETAEVVLPRHAGLARSGKQHRRAR